VLFGRFGNTALHFLIIGLTVLRVEIFLNPLLCAFQCLIQVVARRVHVSQCAYVDVQGRAVCTVHADVNLSFLRWFLIVFRRFRKED